MTKTCKIYVELMHCYSPGVTADQVVIDRGGCGISAVGGTQTFQFPCATVASRGSFLTSVCSQMHANVAQFVRSFIHSLFIAVSGCYLSDATAARDVLPPAAIAYI